MWRKRDYERFLPHTRKPTTACLCMVVLCVFFVIRNGQLDDYTSSDDATAFYYISLFCLLATDAFRLVRLMLKRILYRILRRYRQNKLGLLVAALACGLVILGFIFIPPVFWFWPQFASKVKDSIVFVQCDREFNKTAQKKLACLSKQHLFETEDYKFECKLEFHMPESALYESFFRCYEHSRNVYTYMPLNTQWETGTEIKPKTESEFAKGETMHFVRLQVYFKRLIQSDFLDYSCFAEFHYVAPSAIDNMADADLATINDDLKTKLAHFKIDLENLKTSVQETFIPPGGIIHLIPLHVTEDYEEGDVLFEYRLNGLPIPEEIEDEEYCSFPVISYSQHWDKQLVRKKTEQYEHSQHYIYTKNVPFVYDVASFCVSPHLYGVYTITAIRFFYNQNTKTEDYVEAQVPMVVRLAPSYPGFSGNVEASADKSFFTECWQQDQPIVSEYCSARSKAIRDNLDWHKSTTDFLYGIIVLATPLSLLWLLYRTVRWIMRFVYDGSFSIPTLNTLCDVLVDWTEFPSVANRVAEYDVFVSHDISEVDKAARVMAILQKCGLRVFDSNRSIKPGQSIISSWEMAMEQCAGFVILASRAYVENPELYLQFRTIHYHVMNHVIPEERMLLVLTGQCDIPRSLGPLPIISYYGGFKAYRELVWWARHIVSLTSESVWREAIDNLRRDASHVVDLSRRHTKKLAMAITALKSVYTGRSSRETNMENAASRRSNTEPSQSTSSTASVPSASQSSDGTCSGTEVGTNVEQAPCADEPEHFTLGGPKFRPSAGVFHHDVFLTYCEDSPSDCRLAGVVKERLERVGLRVFDAVQDVLAYEVEQEGIASAVSSSASFVVLLSPSYRRQPLTRRLHFSQILNSFNTGNVSSDNVLLIRTGFGSRNTLTPGSALSATEPTALQLPQESPEVHSYHANPELERHRDQNIQLVPSDPDTDDLGHPENPLGKELGEEHFQLHEGLMAFKLIAWTAKFSDEDYLRKLDQWGRAIKRHVRRRRRGNAYAREQELYRLERIPRQRLITLLYSFRFVAT